MCVAANHGPLWGRKGRRGRWASALLITDLVLTGRARRGCKGDRTNPLTKALSPEPGTSPCAHCDDLDGEHIVEGESPALQHGVAGTPACQACITSTRV